MKNKFKIGDKVKYLFNGVTPQYGVVEEFLDDHIIKVKFWTPYTYSSNMSPYYIHHLINCPNYLRNSQQK